MTALTGLKVVDFSKFLPGPYCTWLLADLGAEVIRIENPRELAKQRKVFGWDKLSDEDNARLRAHDILARGKKSVLIDPGSDDGRAAILKLIDQLEDCRAAIVAAGVDQHAFLAAREDVVRTQPGIVFVAELVPAEHLALLGQLARVFDTDHLGAQIGEQPGAIGAGKKLAEVDDLEAS